MSCTGSPSMLLSVVSFWHCPGISVTWRLILTQVAPLVSDAQTPVWSGVRAVWLVPRTATYRRPAPGAWAIRYTPQFVGKRGVEPSLAFQLLPVSVFPQAPVPLGSL